MCDSVYPQVGFDLFSSPLVQSFFEFSQSFTGSCLVDPLIFHSVSECIPIASDSCHESCTSVFSSCSTWPFVPLAYSVNVSLRSKPARLLVFNLEGTIGMQELRPKVRFETSEMLPRHFDEVFS